MFPFKGLPVGEYDQLLMGAQAKPAPMVGAPSLVWHIALWAPLPQLGRDDARTERRRKIDSYIQDVFRRTQFSIPAQELKHPIDPRNIDTETGQYILFHDAIDKTTGNLQYVHPSRRSSSNQAVTLEFEWHHLLIRMKFELHTEYLSITSIIDLSSFLSEEAIAKHSNGDDIFRGVHDSFKNLQSLVEHNEKNAKSYETIHTHLYHHVWKNFLVEIFTPDSPDVNILEFGELFANFRCIVVGTTPHDLTAAKDKLSFQTPFHRKKEEKKERDDLVDVPPLGQSTISKFWAFLTSETSVDFNRYEFTASAMISGRALYISALGAQPSVVPANQEFPLLYFVYSSARNSWELGRLIDRINALGTLRLAAIMYYARLRDQGVALSAVETDINEAFEAIHGRANPNLARDSNGIVDDDGQKDTNEEKTSRATLKDVQEIFSKIQKEVSKIQRSVDNGIEYRIDRSRYYVRQFNDGTRFLGIKPIPGYQPYDEFVRHRLGSMFQFINMLGIRIDRVQNDKTLLFNYYLTQHNLDIALRAAEREKEIKGLQAVAEIMLFLVLAPYYAGSIFEHIVEHSVSEHEKHETAYHFGMLGGWLLICIFFWWLTYRSVRKHYREHVAAYFLRLCGALTPTATYLRIRRKLTFTVLIIIAVTLVSGRWALGRLPYESIFGSG